MKYPFRSYLFWSPSLSSDLHRVRPMFLVTTHPPFLPGLLMEYPDYHSISLYVHGLCFSQLRARPFFLAVSWYIQTIFYLFWSPSLSPVVFMRGLCFSKLRARPSLLAVPLIQTILGNKGEMACRPLSWGKHDKPFLLLLCTVYASCSYVPSPSLARCFVFFVLV
jgi:hypothetical protein